MTIDNIWSEFSDVLRFVQVKPPTQIIFTDLFVSDKKTQTT